jgi:hypothetical protein
VGIFTSGFVGLHPAKAKLASAARARVVWRDVRSMGNPFDAWATPVLLGLYGPGQVMDVEVLRRDQKSRRCRRFAYARRVESSGIEWNRGRNAIWTMNRERMHELKGYPPDGAIASSKRPNANGSFFAPCYGLPSPQ